MTSRIGKGITEADLVDLHGKVVIVTGGNTGIGYGTVQYLVRKGAKVYIASRNEERIAAAIQQLKSEGINDGTLCSLKVDLGNLRDTKRAAQEFMQIESRLDILVNNAAAGATGPFYTTDDGLYNIVSINYVGHFVFTQTLLPLLKSTVLADDSDVRIVNLSSSAHDKVSPETFVGKDALNKDYGDTFNGWLNMYSHTKVANILHTKELQRRLDKESVPILCISLHPGAVVTEASSKWFRSIPYIGRFAAAFIQPLFFVSSWNEGAMTSAFAAAGKEIAENKSSYKGAYLVPVRAISTPSASAQSERLARELYETTETLLNELGI